jgi:Leucine-rich repeat (LRR) protein
MQSVVAVGNKIVVYGGDCGDHYLEDVNILDLFTFTWSRSLPEEFGDLRSLKVLYLRYCLGMKSLPDSFGKLTNLQDISLLGSSLQMLPNSFGKLTRLKRLDLSQLFRFDHL